MVRAKKDVSKEEHVRPYLERMERQNRYGVYFIFNCATISGS
jgi:hypothetical protein